LGERWAAYGLLWERNGLPFTRNGLLLERDVLSLDSNGHLLERDGLPRWLYMVIVCGALVE
jgi:hypothetical protein